MIRLLSCVAPQSIVSTVSTLGFSGLSLLSTASCGANKRLTSCKFSAENVCSWIAVLLSRVGPATIRENPKSRAVLPFIIDSFDDRSLSLKLGSVLDRRSEPSLVSKACIRGRIYGITHAVMEYAMDICVTDCTRAVQYEADCDVST